MYYGNSFADKATMRLEGKIKRIYAEASRNIENKINDLTRKSALREKEYEAKVKAGKMTQQQLDTWKAGQVFIGKRWRDLRKNIEHELYNTRKSATDMINGERKAVFQDNVNYAMYTIDKDFNFGISFTIYDNATVTRLIKDDPDLVPDVKYPDPNIDYAWSKKQITSAITQGILQGESIPELSKRIGKKLASSNTVSMTRVARTAMTGAQNSGRIQAMHEAQKLDIKVQKTWIATLDNRTRDAHANLDGQVQNIDDPFISDLGPIMFPADPNARPANTWNCRCTLGWEYPEYSNQYDTRAARNIDWEEGGETKQIPYMTYKEWKKWNQTGQLPQRALTVADQDSGERDISLENIAKNVSYGELFDEESKKVTEDILKKLYTQYPLDHPLEFVGDVRISRGYDQGEDVFDLHFNHRELVPATAQYLSDGNKVMPNRKHCIEIHKESASTMPLSDEFNALYELRKKNNTIDRAGDESVSFYVAGSSLEATITHEYGHAVADSAGIFTGTPTGKAKEFREWMVNYYYGHKKELMTISQYAASHPDEMFAEMFVQRFDTEHKDTLAYQMADEVMTKFDEFLKEK